MRNVALYMSILGLLDVTVSRADDAVPTRPNFARYESMLQHSPFAIASAAVPAAATPNFAKDLYVANAGHLPDGDMVTIASTSDRNFREYLTTKGPVDGYAIANIEWSEKVGATKVTISKDGQFATLGFNEALLTANPPPPQPQPPPPPGVPNRAAGAGAAIAVPTPAMPTAVRTPHIRGTISRYPTPRPSPRPGRP